MTTVTNDLDSVSSSKSLSQVDAEAIARDWIAAWNKRDLDAILKHYDGNVKFLSPRVIASFNQQRVGAKDGFIHGLPNLRDYFAKAIETLGDKLQLTLDDVLLGAQYSFAMIYRRETGSLVVETVEVDPHSKKITNVRCFYGDVC